MNNEAPIINETIPPINKEEASILFEKLKQRMKEREEELKRLENPTKEYNEETEKAIKQFANDLLTMYPWLSKYLDEKEIINRVKANLNEDLIYSDHIECSEEQEREGVKNIGSFNPSQKRVKILSDLNDFEKLITKFHEFVHSMVEENPFSEHDHYYTMEELDCFSGEKVDKDLSQPEDSKLDELDYEVIYSDFIKEAIVTLIQEDYERKILNVRRKKVNAYLPHYARQLRAIFGEMLIGDFLVHFKNIDRIKTLFHTGKQKISIKALSEDNDMIQDLIYMKSSDLIPAKNADVEITLTLILQKFLSLRKGLSDRDKLEKISAFVREQITTDFDFIKSIIEEQIKDKSLIREYPLVNYIYNVTRENKYTLFREISLSVPPKNENDQRSVRRDLANLKLKYEDYIVKKFFGLTDYSYDPKRYMMSCDGEKINSYEKYKYFYEVMFDAYSHNMLDDEDFSISSVKGSSLIVKRTIHEQLSTGNTAFDSLLDFLEHGKSSKVKRRNLVTGEVTPYEAEKANYLRIYGEKDYYILNLEEYAPLVKRPMSLDEAIEYYINIIKKIPEVKDAYTLAVNRLIELREEGIDTVFVDKYGFIYEKDSISVSNFIIPEDDEGPADLETETFELKEIDVFFSKKPAKEL